MEKIFSAYNRAWEQGKIKHPLVILIGGHIGTGKSNFSSLVKKKISNTTSLPTGIIRSIQQANTTIKIQPCLFFHSYDLGTINPDIKKSYIENALIGFQKQVGIVEKALANIIKFSDSEGQQYIIDGNHISPEFCAKNAHKSNIVSIFFKVTDSSIYRKMISGPTHKRTLTSRQFLATKYIHNHIVTDANQFNQPIFEYNQTEMALEYVAKCLEKLIPKE